MSRRNRMPALLASLCLLLFAFAVGCASSTTPLQQWASARQALSATEHDVRLAQQGGTLSPQVLVEVDPAIQAARAALQSMKASAQAKDSVAFAKAKADFNVQHDKLLAATAAAAADEGAGPEQDAPEAKDADVNPQPQR